MRPRTHSSLRLPILAGFLATAAPAFGGPVQQDCIVEWQAASGLLPDQGPTPWELVDSSTLDPVLTAGELILCSTDYGDNLYYRQQDAELDLPAVWVLEFSMKFVSGQKQQNSCTLAREPAIVGFELDNGETGCVLIGLDRIALKSDCCTSGAEISLPTADAFHDYRVEVETQTGTIDVHRDGVPILAGVVLQGCSVAGFPRVYFGEASILAFGCHEWRSFRHNGGGRCLGTSYCGPANASSTGVPAEISALGVADVQANDLTLTASSLPPNQFGYFLNSTAQGFVPFAGGSQGNLCLGGAIGRYNQAVTSSGPAGEISLAIDLTQTPTPSGSVAILAGETWNFQLWFRDVNPSPTSNFTDGLSIAFL